MYHLSAYETIGSVNRCGTMTGSSSLRIPTNRTDSGLAELWAFVMMFNWSKLIRGTTAHEWMQHMAFCACWRTMKVFKAFKANSVKVDTIWLDGLFTNALQRSCWSWLGHCLPKLGLTMNLWHPSYSSSCWTQSECLADALQISLKKPVEMCLYRDFDIDQ